ncbi:MAG TPA: tRNA 2-thiouridine(34) synthase MnmA [Anaerolineales bacterium]|nr:tRNA 2-thiouridine(34) synthase MnmA [Anaerolineales bacterium]
MIPFAPVPPKSARVVVAMSGGVDSSVAAALLREQGYEVIGLMMRLWSEAPQPGFSASDNRCCTPDAMGLARCIAAQFDIPFYVIDTREVFRQKIVEFFIQGYTHGVTPNPCMECNRHIRWDFLLKKALELGATHLATGHYARIRLVDGKYQLWRGMDAAKDQSYVLSVMGQTQLQHALFPVGEFTKPQVRELARKFELPTSERKDSQDLCFLADGNYRRFLHQHAPESVTPGKIVDTSGKVRGTHNGLAEYTIGQRKGIRVAAEIPLYVIDKSAENNTLIVGAQNELERSELRAERVNWVSGETPPAPFRAWVQIRYKAQPVPASIVPTGTSGFTALLDAPLSGITSGQAAVVYDEQNCIAGGIITP